MIECIYIEPDFVSGDDVITAQTTGCGCCSHDIHDKEEIMTHLKKNLKVLEDAANIFGMSLQELLIQLSFE